MGKPKKRTSSRKTGMRRSHLVIKLARAVNAKSPVKAKTTKKETGKAKAAQFSLISLLLLFLDILETEEDRFNNMVVMAHNTANTGSHLCVLEHEEVRG